MPACLAQNTLAPGWLWMVVLGCLAVSWIVAAAAGVFRPGSVLGPRRLGRFQPLWPLVLSGMIAVIVWMGVSGVYVSHRSAAFVQAHPSTPFSPSKDLRGHDLAFLATVPDLIAMGVLLLLDNLFDSRISRELDPLPAKLPPAIGPGMIGILAVFPLLLAAGIALDAFYSRISYQHPGEHELLAAMKQATSGLTRALLIFGACVIAPIFEESLFRAHLQTFLVRLFDPPPPQTLAQPPALSQQPGTQLLDYEVPPSRLRSVPRTWLAIFITSIVFAGFHATWMAPLIFILSLCLGYAYERTGNIWVSIIIHALFNALNTAQFLLLM